MGNMKNLAQNTKLVRVLAVAAICAFGVSTASAHHSFAKFDRSKLVTLTGTVRQWTWANPHSWLMLYVKRPGGAIEEWALVGSSPNMLSRWGWNAADIKVGDKVVTDINPGRDAGSHIGALKNVFLAHGKVLVDPGGSTGEALAAGPSQVPTKPQGVAYK